MLGEKLVFQGHNTFLCRHSWLKKGYDFIEANGGFNDADAVVKLGVGKNMVDAIRYWMRAFGLTNEADELRAVAHELLGPDGYDPYIEDNATLWYLHYLLVKTGRASLYHFVFNELRKEGFSFSRAQLQQFVIRRNSELGNTNVLNANTLDADLTVFIRSYAPSGKDKEKFDVEEESTGLLQDLDLLTITRNDGVRYHIENLEQRDIPWQIVLRVILENEHFGETISFTDLEVAPDSPGLIFALNEKGLFHKIEEMKAHLPMAIVYSSTAGNRVLTIKKELINLDEVMQQYYGHLV
ncbi:DUF4007 family protein [Hymenobacter arizonensis]|uniref:DUF4007 domain-containing protein n=1 Tax=Hymenobacter arizonensis TaxID=1227077 RepID=A0A1I5Z7X3_HYMAR|nr:DUF4007 family protein [Hymenobacter arizonensis]SFQ52576.1 Protein of unknown function [Hymenobacter arizonensis]